MAKKRQNQKAEKTYKDDGGQYIVVNEETRQPVYIGDPVVKGRAEYLASNLVHPAEVIKI